MEEERPLTQAQAGEVLSSAPAHAPAALAIIPAGKRQQGSVNIALDIFPWRLVSFAMRPEAAGQVSQAASPTLLWKALGEGGNSYCYAAVLYPPG